MTFLPLTSTRPNMWRGFGLLPWQIVTSNFTAEIGGRYQVDTTDGPVSMTLPEAMVAGDEIPAIQDAKLTWATHPLTLIPATNGLGSVINGGSTYTAPVNGAELSVVAIDNTYGVSVK